MKKKAIVKTIYTMGLASTLALALMFFARPSYAEGQTFTGEISSNNCEVAVSGRTPQQFTRDCVAAGSDYVLDVGDRLYRFANQSDPRLHAHAGEIVTVTGDVTEHLLAASRIEVAKRSSGAPSGSRW